MNYLIEAINLTKKFGDFIADDNLNFSVKKGEIFGVLGANGAGKTTAIKMLCGILSPTSGDAVVGGYSVMKNPDKVKESIGYMSQKFSLYNDLTVEENINFFGGVYGLKGGELKERKEWTLSISNLKGKEKTLTGSLPGGIKQRLALGTAVVHKPKIVFLDEPTSGVDPISRRNFWNLIHDLSDEGVSLLVTTHYLEEAEFCNNIILINAGKIIAEGNPTKLKSDYIDVDIYEIECKNAAHSVEILRKATFTKEIAVFGNKIHLSVERDYNPIEQVNNLLKRYDNIEIKNIEKIIPSLEDVFVNLMEKESRQND